MLTPYQRIATVAPTVDVNVPTTTETVVATIPNVNTQDPGANVAIEATVTLTTGTATTAVVLRIRRGSVTGTIIGEAETDTPIGAAGSTDPYSIGATDQPGEVASQNYVVTVQQTAATGNGTAIDSFVQAVLG